MSQTGEHPVHWLRGGSTSDLTVLCPGSINEKQRWPEEPAGFAAIDGTHTHTLLEKCLDGGHWNASFFLTKTLSDHEGEFVVDMERCKRVNVALGYIKWRLEELSNPFLKTELFVDAGKSYMIPQWGGSADVIIYHDEGIEVIDYKDGGRPVSPDTYQTCSYLIGARNQSGMNYSTFRSTIIQPKVYDGPRFVDYTAEEFEEKIKPLIEAMAESCKPDAIKRAGDHCKKKYCTGAKPGRCESFNRSATMAMTTATGSSPVPNAGAEAASPLMLPDINSDTPVETLVQLIDAEQIVMGVFKDARAEAMKRAQAGIKIPNYKVVRGISQRKWAEDALEKLNKMRVKKEVYTETKLMTPKKVLESDAVKEMSDNQRKKIEALVVKPTGALKLLPESDPGKAVIVDPANAFANVPPPPEQSKTTLAAPPAPPQF